MAGFIPALTPHGNPFPRAHIFGMFCGLRAGINPAPTVSQSIPHRGGVIINTACGGASGRCHNQYHVGAAPQSIPRRGGVTINTASGRCHNQYRGGAVSSSIPRRGGVIINTASAASQSIPPCGASVGAGFIPARNHGGIIHYYMSTSNVRPLCHVRSTLRPMLSAGVRRSGMTL